MDQPVFTHEFPETHHHGMLSIENAEIVAGMDLADCDVGLQVSYDGRIWLCVNGVAWVRFKPHLRTKTGKILTDEDIQALADEAEAGYDVSHLKDRKDSTA